jgi:hypothetical protein
MEVGLRIHSTPVRFNYLLEDCNDLDKLLEKLEVFQAFS